jgi:uncharacterized phage-associated protein
MFETQRAGTFPQHQPPGAYHRPVPYSAHDIAADIRAERRGLPVKKLHKLLYYCQGHHLAWFGEPLFEEPIEAWDMGPVVAELWRAEKRGTSTPPRAELTNRELNTVGYVLSRYGTLTGKDLEILTHGEDPWRDADQGRRPGSAVVIEHAAMAAWFRADHEENSLGPLVIAKIRAMAAEAPPVPESPDCYERVKAMRDELAAEIAAR